MSKELQPHIHKKRQNPLELKKEAIPKKTSFDHAFLYEKLTFSELLKTKQLKFLSLDKDIIQSLKVMSGDQKLSNLIEDAILVYIATHHPSEFENLIKLLKLKRGDTL